MPGTVYHNCTSWISAGIKKPDEREGNNLSEKEGEPEPTLSVTRDDLPLSSHCPVACCWQDLMYC